MTNRRLFRDSSNEVIGGVASGIANYFDVDVTIIRILFVLAAIFGGWGLIVYIIFWVAVPRDISKSHDNSYKREPKDESKSSDFSEKRYNSTTDSPEVEKRKKGSLIGGTVLIIIGAFFIIERYIPRIDFDDFWPFILVIIGLVLLFSGFLKTGKDER